MAHADLPGGARSWALLLGVGLACALRKRPAGADEALHEGAPYPPFEQARLQVLRALQVLDTAPEDKFDNVTKVAQEVFGTEMALVSLVDEDRQWFKSNIGTLNGVCASTPRTESFCAHAILRPEEPLVVLDTWEDERFRNSPLVLRGPKLRFYAGAPLNVQLADGTHAPLGALCVLSAEPRASFDEHERVVLMRLGKVVEHELSARHANDQMKRAWGLYTREMQWLVEAVKNCGEGYFVCDGSQAATVLYVNDGFSEITGRRAVSALGMPLLYMLPPAEGAELDGGAAAGQCEQLREALDAAQRGERRVLNVGLQRPHGQGNENYWAQLSLEAVFRPGAPSEGSHELPAEGAPEGVVFGHLVDVSAHKEAQLQAQRAHKAAEAAALAKSRFVANMSHEVRTPMHAIAGCSSLLAETSMPNEQRELMDIIVAASQQLCLLCNEALDLSKAETLDTEEPMTAPFDLRRSVELVLQSHALNARGRRVELGYEMQPGVPRMVVGDKMRFAQVVQNLVANAIKFSGGGMGSGSVRVRISLAAEPSGAGTCHSNGAVQRGGASAGDTPASLPPAEATGAGGDRSLQLRVEVIDTGPGVPVEFRERIFDPFERVDNSRTRATPGAGLGLSICRSLVTKMGGVVGLLPDAECEDGDGTGSTFYFVLPLSLHEDAAAAAAISKTGTHLDYSEKPVLIVTDSHTVSKHMTSMLSCLGLRHVVTVAPCEAVTMLENGDQKIGFVFFDYRSHQAADCEPVDEAAIAAHKWATSQASGGSWASLLLIRPLGASPSAEPSEVFPLETPSVSSPVSFDALSSAMLSLPKVGRPPSLGTPGSVAEQDFSASRLLVADDERVNVSVLRKILRSLGVQACDVARDGLEAAEMVEKAEAAKVPYDLVVMDLHMPRMDGFEASALITARSSPPKVVALTADTTGDVLEQCRASGMVGCVSKPADKADIKRMLEEQLRIAAQPAMTT